MGSRTAQTGFLTCQQTHDSSGEAKINFPLSHHQVMQAVGTLGGVSPLFDPLGNGLATLHLFFGLTRQQNPGI